MVIRKSPIHACTVIRLNYSNHLEYNIIPALKVPSIDTLFSPSLAVMMKHSWFPTNWWRGSSGRSMLTEFDIALAVPSPLRDAPAQLTSGPYTMLHLFSLVPCEISLRNVQTTSKVRGLMFIRTMRLKYPGKGINSYQLMLLYAYRYTQTL